MSENKHTPEPWRTAERSGFPFHVDDARGESVAMMLADDDHDEQRGLDNARRIVACVNACAGISTENLEDNKPIIELARAYNEALRQRDDLLAALEAMRSVCFDRRKAVEEFERLGELYYREFGRLRPGKDDPMRDSCDEENTEQYNEWSRKRTEAALDLADAAIASVKGGAA